MFMSVIIVKYKVDFADAVLLHVYSNLASFVLCVCLVLTVRSSQPAVIFMTAYRYEQKQRV